MSDAGYVGEMNTHSFGSDFAAISFIVDQLVSRNAHVTWAKVVSVTGGGVGASPVVSVQPLANMLNGQGQPTPHGVLYGLPAVRWQGGASAIIMDPTPGDIGLVLFADRDMSSVKATKAQANPGSRRRFDMADGVYLGGILNTAPTQYIQMTPAGINIVAPSVGTTGNLSAGNGITCSFTTSTGQTVTVQDGIITNLY